MPSGFLHAAACAWISLPFEAECYSLVRTDSICFQPVTSLAVPAGRDFLELDKCLCGDIQLIDDGVDDVGVILHLHLHVIAVTVGNSEKDPVSNTENFPVCCAEGLGAMRGGRTHV